MSKGSRQRPNSITQDEFAKRWDDIFKKPISETQTFAMICPKCKLDQLQHPCPNRHHLDGCFYKAVAQ